MSRSAAFDLAVGRGAAAAPAPPNGLRHDLRLIADMIEPRARVLDIGCGDGALLAYLAREKAVDARGVVLSQTLQATREPRRVLESLVRIGKRAIVSFPNFGFWRIRWSLLAWGRMPVSGLLNHQWYDTPNIHLCTIRDFVALCDEIAVRIERSLTLGRSGRAFALDPRGHLANLLAEQGVFVLSREAP